MTPRDGFPELGDRERELPDQTLTRQPRPVLIVRRRRCRCLLGSVYTVPAGTVLIVRRRVLVADQAGNGVTTTAREQVAVVDVDDQATPVDLGCRHAAGDVVDLAALRDAVASARHAGTEHLI